jgi:hypothetical protein
MINCRNLTCLFVMLAIAGCRSEPATPPASPPVPGAPLNDQPAKAVDDSRSDSSEHASAVAAMAMRPAALPNPLRLGLLARGGPKAVDPILADAGVRQIILSKLKSNPRISDVVFIPAWISAADADLGRLRADSTPFVADVLVVYNVNVSGSLQPKVSGTPVDATTRIEAIVLDPAGRSLGTFVETDSQQADHVFVEEMEQQRSALVIKTFSTAMLKIVDDLNKVLSEPAR